MSSKREESTGGEDHPVFVRDLGSKLDILDKPRKVISAKTNIDEDTLKSDVSRGTMAPSRQNRIAQAYDFRVDHVSWRDCEGSEDTQASQSRDTVDHFRRYFLGPGLKIVADTPRPQLGEDFAKVRVDGENPKQVRIRRGDPLALLDEGYFSPRDVGAGFKVGVGEFRLVAKLPKRKGVAMQRTKSQRRGAKVRVELAGTADEPKFDYFAEPPPMRGHWPEDEKLGLCRGLAAGDEIEIVAVAELVDAFVDRDGTALSEQSGKELKARLLEAMAKAEAMGQPDDSGFVVLCRQTLFVEEGR